MKSCPICLREFGDGLTTCPDDWVRLVGRVEMAPGTIFREVYQIERVLGRGGMGIVYLARHTLLGELRALKFLAPELGSDARAVQRFLREAKRAAVIGLEEPHIVKTLDLGQSEDGSFYICMQYVDGPSLASLLDGCPNGLPVERAVEIARGVAAGLGAAHAKGMVHRDIKPANVLLGLTDGREVAKIADFGIVTGTEDETHLTRHGMQPLTADYASPEQWRGVIAGHELDGRTDLYALGCMLFEMLTGTVPFRGAHAEGLREQHLQAKPPVASWLRPELRSYPGLDELVQRLMAKEREDRPASAKAFLAELQALEASWAAARAQRATVVEPSPVLQPTPSQPMRRAAAPVETVQTSRPRTAPGLVTDRKESFLRRRTALVAGCLLTVGPAVICTSFLSSHASWVDVAGLGAGAGVLVFWWLIAWLVVRRMNRGRVKATGLASFSVGAGITFLLFSLSRTPSYLFTGFYPLAFWAYGFGLLGFALWLVLGSLGYRRRREGSWPAVREVMMALVVWLLAQGLVALWPLMARDLPVIYWAETVLFGLSSYAIAILVIARRLGYERMGEEGQEPIPFRYGRRFGVAIVAVAALALIVVSGQAAYGTWHHVSMLDQFTTAKSECSEAHLDGCKEQLELDQKLWPARYGGRSEGQEAVQARIEYLSCYSGGSDRGYDVYFSYSREKDWNRSCANLGDDYRTGRGVPSSTKLALWAYSWGCSSSAEGDVQACVKAGDLYREGSAEVPIDLSRAREKYLDGCAHGEAGACTAERNLSAVKRMR